MSRKLSTDDIVALIDILDSRCIQFDIFVEPNLFIDIEKIKNYCKRNNISIRLLEDKTTIPIKLLYIRK